MPYSELYWDAAIFHALFAEEKNRVEACRAIVEDAKKGLTLIYTSCITYTECVRIRGKDKLTPDNEGKIGAFFLHKWLRPISCDRIIGEHARLLCWQYESLHPKDAIHIATAKFHAIKILHTYDDGILKLNGKIAGVTIEQPPIPPPPPPPPPPQQKQSSLFDSPS